MTVRECECGRLYPHHERHSSAPLFAKWFVGTLVTLAVAGVWVAFWQVILQWR